MISYVFMQMDGIEDHANHPFFAEKASELVVQGYTSMKFDPFGGAHRQIDWQSERLSIEIVRTVREVVVLMWICALRPTIGLR